MKITTKFRYGDRVRVTREGFYYGATGTIVDIGEKSAHEFKVRLDLTPESVAFMEGALEKIPGGMHD